ncbi:MAG: dephospho-CoA kinase [Chloroflexota bacterium]|nr:dephospho-CoA kinase [Chloroflexota bacterium]
MVVIGLTGGIGTGKSTVSRVLARLGAVIIDAALIGHEVYKPTNPAWKSLTRIFGPDILLPDNQVDRQKLGDIVFNDPAAMAKLNAIMRPEIRNVLIERLKKALDQGGKVAVLDSATLIDAGWTALADEVWLVIAPKDMIIKRLRERDGLSDDAISARLASQLSNEEQLIHVDQLIENNGTLTDLTTAVEELWTKRIETKVSNDGAT